MKMYLFGLLWLLTSCAIPKNMIYFTHANQLAEQQVSQNYENRVKSDDLLYITVTSSNPELAGQFNPQTLSKASSTTPTSIEYSSYLVDSKGEIVLPVLGRMNLIGLTHREVASKIEKLIIEGQYINDPSVTVKLINYKVSVLGEVKAPGVKQISSERVTLFDALGLAGDLTIYGKRENVSIIREVNGARQIATVDLSNKSILTSPYYYLQPNDIVYVQPNKKQQRSSVWEPYILSTALSSTSVLLSVLSIILR